MADPTTPGHAGPIASFSLVVMLLAALLIQPWEGRSLKPYRDIVGVLTVCDGHTGNVQQRPYTEAECDKLLSSDLGSAWATVRDCYDTSKMTEFQAAALVSLSFRVGPGAPGVKDGVC